MFEWLDGYWTAMRHAAVAEIFKNPWGRTIEVATATGTIAAVAILSARSTSKSAKASMELTAKAYHKDQRPWISDAVHDLPPVGPSGGRSWTAFIEKLVQPSSDTESCLSKFEDASKRPFANGCNGYRTPIIGWFPCKETLVG